MLSRNALLSLFGLAAGASAAALDTLDPAGYFTPSQGTASTTQFSIGSEFSQGTSCGVHGLSAGQSVSGAGTGQGGGSGLLYAAVNQLAFGANPSTSGAGGAGGACGLCYQLTPVLNGAPLPAQALTFMIVDECPASPSLSGGQHCTQCSTGDVNDFGQPFHFDIAVDAMSQQQYDTFYQGCPQTTNWPEVEFQQVACDPTVNAPPPVDSAGCVSGSCANNDAAPVCQGVSGVAGP